MRGKSREIPPAPDAGLAEAQAPPDGPDLPKLGLFKNVTEAIRKRFNNDDQPTHSAEGTKSPINFLTANMDVEAAMASVLAHKNFRPLFAKSNEASGWFETALKLRSLDNLESFSIPDDKSEALWRLEAERLISGVNDMSADVLFPEIGIPGGDYTFLSSLVTDILALDNICVVDNEVLAREFVPEMHSTEDFDRGRSYLRQRMTSTRQTKTHSQALTKEKKQDYMFALIDFITLNLARTLVYSASEATRSTSWGYSCIACIVKYVAKLKVVARDPVAFAAKCLDTADDAAKIPYKNPGGDDGPSSETPQPTGMRTRLYGGHGNQFSDKMQAFYCAQEMLVRIHIINSIKYVLHGLQGQSYLTATTTTYEICSVVYETGLERFRTWVHQERDGDLQGTACQKSLAMARPAFELLQETARALREKQKQQPPLRRGDEEHRTWLRWKDIISDEDNTLGSEHNIDDHLLDHSIDMHSIEEIITILVPLLTASPQIIVSLPEMLQAVTITENKPGQHQKSSLSMEAGRFKAFFCLSAVSLTEAEAGLASEDTSSLSNGLMTRDKLLRGPKVGQIRGKTFMSSQTNDLKHSKSHLQALTRANHEMSKWVYEENAVMVDCKMYVWTTIFFALVLAVGGVAIGFTVRDRIKAVDPFNITTYCWVLAGFSVLVAKSVRVEIWSWRDFLRGRVRCRSVTELHSVTRIPGPLILCKLLDTENTTILNTRGPYNAVFQRRNDGGFSIDTPLTMWTMLLSGLIMVMVSTTQGPALVCLDVRRGTRYSTISHDEIVRVRTGRTRERLVCVDMTRSDSLLPIQRTNFEWRAMVGIYRKREARFI
ncbi:hypothetical protein N0V84_004698 [Fusarium piperis]|uniref:Uncharacterized protein n=1 Tax=Fusarium piperis TaxID=1435070 RepID=A0A9W9BQ69_9HYPO|nr:hypothetical protein N0V84_004698 [Fusarium piperis]